MMFACSAAVSLLLSAAALPVDALPDGTPLEPGLSLRIWDTGLPLTAIPRLVPGQSPNESRLVSDVDFRRDRAWSAIDDGFYAIVEGWLVVETPGQHRFELRSDDGSRLAIDGRVIIEMDRPQSPTASAGQIDLEAGLHPIRIEYFEATGGQELRLRWQPPGATALSVVPSSALRTIKGQVRPTSPGRKTVWSPALFAAPGDGRPLDAVHPSFRRTSLRPEGFEPRVGGLAFLPDGRLLVACWEPSGGVYRMNGDAAPTPIAAGLAEPLGLAVVDGRIFVLQKHELTELVDRDGDGVIDEYRCVAGGWPVTSNFHEFAFGLEPDGDDFLANLAIAIDPGGRSTRPQVEGRGSTIRIRRDGTYEAVAHGLRTPNGIGRGGDGHVYITDNQGDWLPSSNVHRVVPGAFYGSQSVLLDAAKSLPVTPPVVWLPQGEIGNSPSQVAPLSFGPWAGQMVIGDVTHGGLKRVQVEEISTAGGDVVQGCVFRFTQGLDAGINRVIALPADAGPGFVVGGIGSSGDWGQEGKKRFGLERLDFTGAVAFEPLAVRAVDGGFDIEFTTPLAAGVGERAEDYLVRSWRYEPTEAYGGPKLDERTHAIAALAVSEDRKRVYLAIEGLEAGRVVHLRLFDRDHWRDAEGREPWTTEAWYTLNALPGAARTSELAAKARPTLNRVTASEAARGWRPLFDGKTFAGLRNWRKPDDAPIEGWSVEPDGTFLRSGPGGDLVTIKDYASFELRYEWKVEPGGNSGVMFRATEDRQYPWETGPEMQILDDERHGDGGSLFTSAGANYALHAPIASVARPAGEWNTARLLVDGNRVVQWLNGIKTAEYELGSAEWRELVAKSKFASMPDYGTRSRGKIVFQDHGDRVWFRNVVVREIE